MQFDSKGWNNINKVNVVLTSTCDIIALILNPLNEHFMYEIESVYQDKKQTNDILNS